MVAQRGIDARVRHWRQLSFIELSGAVMGGRPDRKVMMIVQEICRCKLLDFISTSAKLTSRFLNKCRASPEACEDSRSDGETVRSSASGRCCDPSSGRVARPISC